ncbi:hypothetical protein JTE90_025466 [Oedothorax gibbosus]|uniref:Uncharacterized protein n=1 Tax=Oedothorax gibbosus TaxID=931172 RepID=A0AAV6UZ31_9ARAC|nr:hypothetical protein JTE90_025466 [Oedothorax gibbosus]
MSLDNFKQLNYELPLVSTDTVEEPTNDDNNNAPYESQNSFKRRRTEDYSELGMYSNKLSNYLCTESRNYFRSKTFLSVRHNSYVYHTEEWKPKGCTMYLPLCEDIMINTHNIEQMSFETDQFFLADEKGNYVGAKPGNAVHLWRFDSTMKKLYISRSILFLKEQDYHDVQFQLGNL